MTSLAHGRRGAGRVLVLACVCNIRLCLASSVPDGACVRRQVGTRAPEDRPCDMSTCTGQHNPQQRSEMAMAAWASPIHGLKRLAVVPLGLLASSFAQRTYCIDVVSPEATATQAAAVSLYRCASPTPPPSPHRSPRLARPPLHQGPTRQRQLDLAAGQAERAQPAAHARVLRSGDRCNRGLHLRPG